MSAFSNGTEFDVFQERNCWKGPDCRLWDDCGYILDALIGNPTPDEWTPNAGMGRYDCGAYEPV